MNRASISVEMGCPYACARLVSVCVLLRSAGSKDLDLSPLIFLIFFVNFLLFCYCIPLPISSGCIGEKGSEHKCGFSLS